MRKDPRRWVTRIAIGYVVISDTEPVLVDNVWRFSAPGHQVLPVEEYAQHYDRVPSLGDTEEVPDDMLSYKDADVADRIRAAKRRNAAEDTGAEADRQLAVLRRLLRHLGGYAKTIAALEE